MPSFEQAKLRQIEERKKLYKKEGTLNGKQRQISKRESLGERGRQKDKM